MEHLHLEVLTPQGLSLWQRLGKAKPILNEFYLAGGTALALQLGHRISIDFDFFTQSEIKPNLQIEFGQLTNSQTQILSANSSTVEFIADKVKIMFWQFHYPLLENLLKLDQLKLATPKSIGLFKLIALEGRSTWKDIIDLYFIHLQVCNLSLILDEYKAILPNDFASFYRNLKNLFNESDLAKSVKPNMLIDVGYDQALSIVRSEILNYFKII